MAPVTIERLPVEQAQRRRTEILAELGMSAERLHALSERYALDGHQRALASEYERLSFLLASDT